jgi:outer membrane protein assembly factor BamB
MPPPTTPFPAPAPKPVPPGDEHPWKQPARRVAWVAAIYCAIIAVALIFSYFRSRATDPINNRDLARLKASLVQTPLDERLKSQIRTLDVDLRTHYLAYMARVQQSGWLLLAGALALLPALHYATWRKRLPRPGKYVLQPLAAEKDATRSRWAVAAVGALAGGLGLLAVNSSQSELAKVAATKKVSTGQSNAVQQVDTSIPTPAEIARHWPRFRGPSGSAMSAFTNVPITWNGTNGQGVVWKTALPYPSPNSPVVWGNRIFLTGGDSGQREVFCFDTADGKMLWHKPVGKPGKPLPKEDEEGRYFATSTCATDGRRVYAIFETGDVAAFDYQGNQVWAKNLGKPDNQYGYATSLEVCQNTLLVQWDEGDEEANKSKIIALNTATGAEAWKSAPRPVGASWATPILINTGAREQLIACGNPWLMSYDPANGTELWRAKICRGEVTPSAVFAGGFVVTANEELHATKPDGTGDVTKSHVAWKAQDGIPDICSPLCDGKYVYLLTSSGILTVYELASGKKAYEKEVEMEFKASPSGAGGRIYLAVEKGVTVVFQGGPEYKELARSSLGEEMSASPAFADGRIYLRGKNNLFCLGK